MQNILFLEKNILSYLIILKYQSVHFTFFYYQETIWSYHVFRLINFSKHWFYSWISFL